ncbi:MAG: hypothetical protein AAF438_05075 [Pseudomonadota bacterium]
MKHALIVGLGLSVFGVATADQCEEDYSQTLEVSESMPASMQQFFIDAQAGSLEIVGESGTDEMVAIGEACASSQKLLDKIRLESKSDSDGVSVYTDVPTSQGGWFGNVAYLHVKVRLPSRVFVSIEDSSGSIKVRDVSGLDVDDSSGSIDARSIMGPVSIIDSSGSLTLNRVEGDVRLNDGSGSITVKNVQGSVRIEDDGSGSIDIRKVRDNVIVEDDGSGSIRVSDVGGDFSVGSDGSGGIHYDDVMGSVSIPED